MTRPILYTDLIGSRALPFKGVLFFYNMFYCFIRQIKNNLQWIAKGSKKKIMAKIWQWGNKYVDLYYRPTHLYLCTSIGHILRRWIWTELTKDFWGCSQKWDRILVTPLIKERERERDWWHGNNNTYVTLNGNILRICLCVSADHYPWNSN